MNRDKTLNQGVAPVTYGEGDRPPRGDYTRARSDFTCEQNYDRYGAADHETYRRLYARQVQQLPGLACEEFIAAVESVGGPALLNRAFERAELLPSMAEIRDPSAWVRRVEPAASAA